MMDADEDNIDGWRRGLGVRVYRFILLMLDGFNRTELTRRAAALTYTTILSLFPLLAVLTSVMGIFYTEEREAELSGLIERTLLPTTFQEMADSPNMTENERRLYEQQKKFSTDMRALFGSVSSKFRENARGVGIFGFIGVLITAGLLYASIESVVNQTWQTTAGRWVDTIRNFILMIIFAIVTIGLSGTVSTFAVTLFSDKAHTTTPAPPPGPSISAAPAEPPPPPDQPQGLLRHVRKVTTKFAFILPLLPFLINTVILSLAYCFLPNTRVNLIPAFAGGLTASLLWEAARYMFFYYVYLSTINRTLADALGLSVIFLIWVYITWLILLMGNLVVYVSQNYRSLWAERRGGGEMMLDGRLLVATMLLLARRFKYHAPGYTESELRQRLALRKEEFDQIIQRLKKSGFVVRLESGAFQVAQPPEDIRLADLLALGCNLDQLPIVDRMGPVSTSLRRLQEETIQASGDRRLSDLLTN
jgi:uncharacterized BrkB/YihY/UPF0761 family membrane protein